MSFHRWWFILVEFIAKYRTKISQLLGVVYLLVFALSAKKFEIVSPLASEIMVGAGCVFIGIGIVGRLWCALYIAGHKAESLITVGPYSVCRNPLYLFSLLGGTGIGLCTESLTFTLIILLAFAVIYPVTVYAEERNLMKLHGESYRNYLASVPRFIPKWRLYREPAEYSVDTRVFRREMADALCFALVIAVFELLDGLIDMGIIKTLFSLY
jgi:protein-S-isoprenylcysteine O-methyltransferase Ste14